MGCVTSKQAVSVTPAALDNSGVLTGGSELGSGRSRLGSIRGLAFNLKKVKKRSHEPRSELDESEPASSNGCGSESVSFRLGNLHRYVEGEQVAAGWPAWLSAVAGEAIQGWVPAKAESYEKLEKIGQGTYSSVFRARDLESGKIVALKKVRFDNFEPESVRFMAREIIILRRLDHPNIIKLEGIITSRLSCSIYLVFEYMEHDISGLLSCPDIKFSQEQVKCYMKQLLLGLEHCHSRGVMHRDIKGANLLVDNEGVLKLADFGLANFCSYRQKQPLTSRVVTLWYRPPELLLGSTDYGASVDLWSVGCVFAELLMARPILQGRTEVEQLHKIFKLCGSPPDDYWKKSKLPHATLFKPQHPYESCLRQTFKDLPKTAVTLIETLLSVEPYKRGTKLPVKTQVNPKINGNAANILSGDKELRLDLPKPSTDGTEEAASHVKNTSQGDDTYLGPLQVSGSSGFAWARRQMHDSSIRSRSRSSSRSLIFEPSEMLHSRNNLDSQVEENNVVNGNCANSKGNDSCEAFKHSMLKQWRQLERPDSFDMSDEYHSQELSVAFYNKDERAAKRISLVYQNQEEKVEFSGPLLSQSQRIDDLLEKHERHIRQAVRKSWFQRVKRNEK
ncbi:probable serine threonine- kinase At1g54610 [Olea europaea subsp. europaea]|uniref:Probable serine threonine- kinase At1g54610 n=1 Tax=Olea europaea subsp. europaea TaxID=158383 RepID=A0A8S0QDK5_OLEEU|nr:probable serine threonine- kinase At1g54610 [Olea europaea subsp. europaea]